jgi:TatA/E family protein of Tat protein translocase
MHWIWIVALLLIVLIVFGPRRLVKLGGGFGKAITEFRKEKAGSGSTTASAKDKSG